MIQNCLLLFHMISYKDNGEERKAIYNFCTGVEHFMNKVKDLLYSTWKRLQILGHVHQKIYSHSQ